MTCTIFYLEISLVYMLRCYLLTAGRPTRSQSELYNAVAARFPGIGIDGVHGGVQIGSRSPALGRIWPNIQHQEPVGIGMIRGQRAVVTQRQTLTQGLHVVVDDDAGGRVGVRQSFDAVLTKLVDGTVGRVDN